MSSFIEMCLSGDTLPDDIDDFVDKWHESDSDLPIHEYLGMTRDEYLSWVKDPSVLLHIVSAHHVHGVRVHGVS